MECKQLHCIACLKKLTGHQSVSALDYCKKEYSHWFEMMNKIIEILETTDSIYENS